MDKDTLYKKHILEAIAEAETFVLRMSCENFRRDKLRRAGVVRELEIIGEAANHLSAKFRNRYPDIPWHDIVGLRNRIIHEYFKINYKRVWNVVKKNLPKLKSALKK